MKMLNFKSFYLREEMPEASRQEVHSYELCGRKCALIVECEK